MKYFIDLEFIEQGHKKPIHLISIGIIAEDGRKYYAVDKDCPFWESSAWVWDNVLTPMGVERRSGENCMVPVNPEVFKSRVKIKQDILDFVGDDTPEFWGEWSAYDWVVFCQIFGAMIDLPTGWPMRCRDVVQWCVDDLGLSTDDWPKSLEVDGNHNALLGAATVKARWEWCDAMARTSCMNDDSEDRLRIAL